ncbi:MAG: DNA-3-methyladenine glycosylase [Ignavibacteriae bacterium]|nr:DNA-3-methyladenine glycosylase [Ignavibacteriota bacterium]
MKPLPRSFYLRPTTRVAQDLLGKYIVRKFRGKLLIGKIVETEAYCTGDPAAHSFRGKTTRNAVMFDACGHLYVYFTYGMHWCANVVTQKIGIGEAVLIRAVEPIAGVDIMKKNRQRGRRAEMKGRKIVSHQLTNGPAKFCQAFAITGKDNGTDLLGKTIYILNGERTPASNIKRSTRIGIRVGIEKQWRFFVKDNPWVSK